MRSILLLSLFILVSHCTIDDADDEEREQCKGERKVSCRKHHERKRGEDEDVVHLEYKRGVEIGACPTMPSDEEVLKIAFVGDFGYDSPGCESVVAHAIASVEPDEVVSLGDNNYHHGKCESIRKNIHDHYRPFVGGLEDVGCVEPIDEEEMYGSDVEDEFQTGIRRFRDTIRNAIFSNASALPRFWPVLGNHDVDNYVKLRPQGRFEEELPYFQYFLHLNGSAYYDRRLDSRWSPDRPDIPSLHLFAIDSTATASMLEEQRLWVSAGLRASPADYRIVVMHHAPFSSSGHHEAAVELRWPFAEWGASAVLSGHVHAYERVEREEDGGMPYVVNGLGGIDKLYEVAICDAVTRGSQFRYDAAHGFLMAYFGKSWAGFCFHSMADGVVDSFNVEVGRRNLSDARPPGPAPPSADAEPTPAPQPDVTVTAHSTAHSPSASSSSSTLLYALFAISAIAVGVCAGVIASHRSTTPAAHDAEA